MLDDGLKTVAEAVIVTDLAGCIVHADEAAGILFGYTNNELLSLQADDLISEQHRKQLSIQRESLAARRSKRTNAAAQDLTAWTHERHEIPVDVQLTLMNLDGNRYVITTFRSLVQGRELERIRAHSDKQLQTITAMSSDWYWQQDADLRFTYISGWGKETHITNSESVIGKTRSEMPYEYESEAKRVGHEQTLAQREAFRNLLIRNPENDRYAQITGEPVFDARGEFCGYHGVARDVTDEKRAQNALRNSEARFRALTVLSSDWYWEQDADLRFTLIYGENDHAQLNTIDSAKGKTRFELPYNWESSEARAEHERLLAERKPFRDLLLHNPANDRYALVSGEPAFDERSEFCGYHGLSRDVTAEKRAEHAMQKSEARFRALATMSYDWFWEQDENLRYTYLSPTGQANVSAPLDTIIGHTRFELPLVFASQAAKQEHADTLEARRPFRDLLLTTESRDQYTYVSGEPVFDDDGTFRGYQGVTKDVTDRKMAEAEALQLATHDALTELPNRALLVDRLERAIAQALRTKRHFAVLFIDMDRFKTLNDTFGHGIGDEFLQKVSMRLEAVLRRSDTLARFGGDEFVVVLERLRGNSDAEAIAAKLLKVLAEAVELNGIPYQTTASIGISMYPDNGTDTETLLRHADLAMYEAKDAGRGCLRFYEDEMNQRALVRATLDRELRDALEHGQFELYFHPQHDISTGKVDGAEVLLRWNHPVRGLVAPGEFISAAEESGLILPIGQFVLERTFATIAGWLSRGVVPPRLAINISSRQLQDGDTLLNQAKALLKTSGVPHGLIEFEITESLLIQSGDEASMNVLQNLGELGIRLAIDDFGTGYSSLSYLKRLPVHAIKIDQAFVNDITSNEESAAIVRAVVGLAHNIKLEVVSEGVETEEQLEILRHMGCDTYQGYLREKPMPQQEFETSMLGLTAAEDPQVLHGARVAIR
jgi:diguanylate cyclase (GGDEF)-like protein/PAS domain S-box-containing protein